MRKLQRLLHHELGKESIYVLKYIRSEGGAEYVSEHGQNLLIRMVNEKTGVTEGIEIEIK